MGGLSFTHILVLAVVGIIFFGPKRLPQLGQSLGEGIRGFKKAMDGDTDEKPQAQQQPQQHQNYAQRQPELPLQDPVSNARVVEETQNKERS